MTQTAATCATNLLPAGSTRHGKEDRRVRKTGFLVLVGSIVSAAVGAAFGYRTSGVECVPLESPFVVRGASPATIPFLLRNAQGSAVKLRARTCECGVHLEGVPTDLGPYQSAEGGLVVSKAGLSGRHQFTAAISTDSHPQLVAVTANVEIYADWAVRQLKLGSFPARTRVVTRLLVDNVPAQKFVRIDKVSAPNWSAQVVSTNERSVEIELAGETPSTQRAPMEKQSVCSVDLFFNDVDVRRLHVIATAVLTDANFPRLVLSNGGEAPFTPASTLGTSNE